MTATPSLMIDDSTKRVNMQGGCGVDLTWRENLKKSGSNQQMKFSLTVQTQLSNQTSTLDKDNRASFHHTLEVVCWTLQGTFHSVRGTQNRPRCDSRAFAIRST